MRKFLAVLAVVVAVLVAALVYAAFNLNSFLQTNRGWLADRASDALGREVQFDEIGISFRGGLGASVSGLRIGEAAGFADTPFLRVASANVLVDPWAALRGEYKVSEVTLDSPDIRLLRTAKGFNVESFGRAKAGGAAAGDKGAGDEHTGGTLPVLITNLTISDGRVTYVDRTASPAREIEVSGVDLEVDGIGSPSPIRIDASARLFGEKQDVFVTGSVGPVDFAVPGAAPLDITATLGPLSIDAAKQVEWIGGALPPDLQSDDPVALGATIGGTVAAPTAALSLDGEDADIRFGDSFHKPAGVALRFDGRVDRTADKIRVRDGRLKVAEAALDLSGTVSTGKATRYDLQLSGGEIPLSGWERMLPALQGYDLAGSAKPEFTISGTGSPQVEGTVDLDTVALTRESFRVSGLSTRVEVDGKRIRLPESRFQLNEAPVAISASYDIEPSTWTFGGDVTGLALGPLLGEYAPAAARMLEGLLDADLELRGRGTTWDTIRDAMTGSGKMTIRDGVLRKLNITDEVLRGLTGLKGLTNLISPDIRSKYPGLLKAEDTPFETFGGAVRIADGRVSSDDFELSARQQDIRGKGWVSLAGAVEATATMIASTELSADLVHSVKELKPLLDEGGRLRVPFEMKGQLPGARPQPDVDYLVRRLGRSALESGLDRLFRKDEPEADASGTPGPTPTPRPEEQLLRRGLDALFGR